MKTCPICRTSKTANDFYKCSSTKDGLQRRCKNCIAAYLEARNYEPVYDGQSVTCSTCNASKPKDQFYPDRRQRTGLRPECKRCNRNTVLKRQFGIDIETYEALLKLQDNKCAICNTTEALGHGTFHVDHCHTTGRVRGLLCTRCNSGLGHFTDSESKLLKAIEYLRKYNANLP